jgi:hypothetical protein
MRSSLPSRAGSGLSCTRSRRPLNSRCATRALASPQRSCHVCSSGSIGFWARAGARMRERGLDWRSSRSWPRCTAARCASPVTSATAVPSSCPCPSEPFTCPSSGCAAPYRLRPHRLRFTPARSSRKPCRGSPTTLRPSRPAPHNRGRWPHPPVSWPPTTTGTCWPMCGVCLGPLGMPWRPPGTVKRRWWPRSRTRPTWCWPMS